jgi:transcriptional regulator with XRE-family HTH domain
MTRTFADEIRQAREEKKLSQAKLATLADVSASTVYRAEKGEELDEDTRRKLRAALGLARSDQPGHSLSVLQNAPLRPGERPSKVGAMGQLVGHMMMHGGSAGADPFTILTELAVATEEPSGVFRALALARRDAPADAGWDWWIRAYAEAKKEAGTT